MHEVSVPVIAPVAFECRFWLDNDCWHAVAEGFEIAVQGGSFEDAKRNMETALSDYVQSLVRKPHPAENRTAA